MEHPFRVGEVYENRNGKYRVISIDEPQVTVRYESGGELRGDIETLARIWVNIQAEKAYAAAPAAEKTRSGTSRRTARTNSSDEKPSGKASSSRGASARPAASSGRARAKRGPVADSDPE